MSWLNLIKNAAHMLGGAGSHEQPNQTQEDESLRNKHEFFINGNHHLFRDEGTCIEHFVAGFKTRIVKTRYGDKLLPEVAPHWRYVSTHAGQSLEAVVSKVIHEATGSKPAGPGPARAAKNDGSRTSSAQGTRTVEAGESLEGDSVAATSADTGARSDYESGTLTFWGDLKFPKRRKQSSAKGPDTYTSFALKLQTNAGEKTIQGEGLKDAIADAGCKLGDRVAVKRLYKTKVPAFDQKSGAPLKDPATGEQKLWDKWVFNIQLVH